MVRIVTAARVLPRVHSRFLRHIEALGQAGPARARDVNEQQVVLRVRFIFDKPRHAEKMLEEAS